MKSRGIGSSTEHFQMLPLRLGHNWSYRGRNNGRLGGERNNDRLQNNNFDEVYTVYLKDHENNTKILWVRCPGAAISKSKKYCHERLGNAYLIT